MVRSPVVAALTALLLEACSSVPPIYLPSSPPPPAPVPAAAYALEVKVVPRIGLFDELLYACKSDYTDRIWGQVIERSGILPGEWDAIIPRFNEGSQRGTPCKNTRVGDLTQRYVRLDVLRDGKIHPGGCSWRLDTSKFFPAEPVAGSCSYHGTLNSNDAVPFRVAIDGTELSGEVPQDTLIVSMGDSYASGEGNPDGVLKSTENAPNPASVTWMSRRCHRSLWAGPIRAGLELAARRIPQGPSVGARGAYTILSTACSGAELRDMTTRGYLGRETLEQMSIVLCDKTSKDLPRWCHDTQYAARRRVPAQVEQIRDILKGYAKCGGRPPIDVVVLSMGGNDINFGQLVVGLVTRRNPLENQNIANGVRDDIQALANDFEQLATRLDTGLYPSASSPSVDQVLLTGYPDPTKVTEGSATAKATYCDCRQHGFLGLGPIEKAFLCIKSSESKDASESVIKPLNAGLKRIAEKFGWLFVPRIEESLVGHAWCQDARGASARYVRTYADSIALQGVLPGTTGVSTGAMHPSANGHEKAYSDNIRAAFLDERVKFKVISEFVDNGDGTLIVPPTLMIGWEGSLLDATSTKEACEQVGNPKYCPLDFPLVWWAGTSNFDLCPGPDHANCAFDAATKTLMVKDLGSSGAGTRELFVKARDGVTKARLPASLVGRLLVDDRTPTIDTCRMIYPEGQMACPDRHDKYTWLRAEGGRLELAASVGESGFRRWRCEGTLLDRCGPDSLLAIDKLPSGYSTLRAVAENRVGIRSSAIDLVLRVDTEAPTVSQIAVAGHEFRPGEPLALLSKEGRLTATFRAEDGDSRVRVVSRRGFDCVSTVTLSATHVLSIDHDGNVAIEAVDCAVPAGNSALATIEVVRPMKAPTKARALGVDQWRARLNAESDERAELVARLAKITPRYADPGAVTDSNWPVLAAWLNLVSGRSNPGGPGKRFACNTSGPAPYFPTNFALLKAVEVCVADPATPAKIRERATSVLQRAKLLSTVQ